MFLRKPLPDYGSGGNLIYYHIPGCGALLALVAIPLSLYWVLPPTVLPLGTPGNQIVWSLLVGFSTLGGISVSARLFRALAIGAFLALLVLYFKVPIRRRRRNNH